MIKRYLDWLNEAVDTATTQPAPAQANETEPDLSKFDWSSGGIQTWRDSPLVKIIAYTEAKDANKEYSKIAAYKGLITWFKENADDPQLADEIRDSLIIWLGNDPYYGLVAARTRAAESGSEYSEEKPTSGVIDDATRQRLLVEITKATNEKIKNPVSKDTIAKGETDIAAIVAKASYISIYKDGEKTSTETTATGSPTTMYITKQYPDATLSVDDRRTISENLFPDDGDKLGPDAINGIWITCRTISNEWKAFKTKYKDANLVSVEVLGFASTSKVNSSYGTGGVVYNQANNVKLAKARLDVMTKAMLEDLKEQSSSWGVPELGEEAIISSAVNSANIGPDWETIGGSSDQKQYTIDDYGPLLAAAQKANPKITPKQFYSIEARKTNANIKAEYESIYATFRKSTVGIRITVEATETTAPAPEKITKTIGIFEVTIVWPDNSKPTYHYQRGNDNRRYSKPKNTGPVFSGRKTDCPIF